TLRPGGGSTAKLAWRGFGPRDGDRNTIGGDFGSTVSRYCVNDRSSRRPPLRAIEPARRGVSMCTRGDCASASSRVSALAGGCSAGGGGGVPGVLGAPAPGGCWPG